MGTSYKSNRCSPPLKTGNGTFFGFPFYQAALRPHFRFSRARLSSDLFCLFLFSLGERRLLTGRNRLLLTKNYESSFCPLSFSFFSRSGLR